VTRLLWMFVAVGSLMGIACLHKQLNPGRCNSNSDCPSGQICDLSAQANGTCVCSSPGCDGDAGAGGGTGGAGSGGGGTSGGGGSAGNVGGSSGSAGTGGAAGCQPACTAPRAICAPNLTCVECVSSADCMTATKPICDTGTGACVACASDAQCVAKLNSADPGVCMAHQDGRCATVEETLFVENKNGCNDTATGPGAGTLAQPFCSMQPVATFLSSTHDVVVIRGTVSGASWTFSGQGAAETSMVGQRGAFVAALGAVPAFGMTNGAIYIRGVKFSSSASIGVKAAGGTLRLDTVTVDGCMGGGILLDGAAFDIRNTTVTRSGPGDDGGLPWGGIRIKNPPTSGINRIALSTVRLNDGGGISCSAMVDGMTGVLAVDNMNTPSQVGSACGFSSCEIAGPTCGAQ
jgi:hypothetical protein